MLFLSPMTITIPQLIYISKTIDYNRNKLYSIGEIMADKLIKKCVTITKEQYAMILEKDGVSFSDKLRRVLDEYKKL